MARPHIPDHARAALQYLADKFRNQPAAGVDVSWAERIVAKYRQGDSVAAATLQMACEALRIPYPPHRGGE